MTAGFRHLFDKLARVHGPWSLFAVLRRNRREPCPWFLVVAAPWLGDPKPFADMRLILGTLDEGITPRQRSLLGGVMVLSDPDDVAAAAAELLGGRPAGRTRLGRTDFRGRAFRRGAIWAVNLPEPAGTSLVPTAPAA